jgi:hypothetical protein
MVKSINSKIKKEYIMSVRATDSLIADAVVVTDIPNSPKMVVLSVNAEAKQVTTIWFSDAHEAQQATFPSSSLDRVEAKVAPAKKPAAGGVKKAPPGKKKK